MAHLECGSCARLSLSALGYRLSAWSIRVRTPIGIRRLAQHELRASSGIGRIRNWPPESGAQLQEFRPER